jgi:CBS domain-containing protein
MTDVSGTRSVAEIAEPHVVALDGMAPIEDAARTMAKRRIGSVAVLEQGEIVGLVTERDLAIAVLVGGAQARDPLRRAMRPEVPRVKAEASEAACAAIMRQHATRHLLVEERGRVVGVVSQRDLVEAMLDDKQHLIEQLATYITGYGVAPAWAAP